MLYIDQWQDSNSIWPRCFGVCFGVNSTQTSLCRAPSAEGEEGFSPVQGSRSEPPAYLYSMRVEAFACLLLGQEDPRCEQSAHAAAAKVPVATNRALEPSRHKVVSEHCRFPSYPAQRCSVLDDGPTAFSDEGSTDYRRHERLRQP